MALVNKNAKQQMRIRLEGECRRMAEMITPQLRAGVGFALMLLDHGPDGSISYVSSLERDGMMQAMRELVANIDRRDNPEGIAGRVVELERQLAQARAALDAQTEELAKVLRERDEARERVRQEQAHHCTNPRTEAGGGHCDHCAGLSVARTRKLAELQQERDEARAIARRLRCDNDGQPNGGAEDLAPLCAVMDGWPEDTITPADIEGATKP